MARSVRSPDDGSVWDAWLDLVLGSRCAVCGLPGRLLCRPCAEALPRRARPAWPDPAPHGLATPVAAGEYAGALQQLVLAHKERRQFALARPLGGLLADAAHALLGDALVPDRPAVLVPVPSRRPVVRSRGHDPVLRMTRAAAAVLRRRGGDVHVARLLRSGTVRDQAGLDASARAVNLAGSMTARSSMGVRGHRGDPVAVVTDDVITTGSTAREAQRVLEGAGVRVAGIATVAATRRRMPPGRAEPGGSLPLSVPDD